jgi:hypothetical protein
MNLSGKIRFFDVNLTEKLENPLSFSLQSLVITFCKYFTAGFASKYSQKDENNVINCLFYIFFLLFIVFVYFPLLPEQWDLCF